MKQELEFILKFKEESKIATFLKTLESFNLSAFEVHSLSMLIFYHLDIIIAIHNIKSLYNPTLSITQKNIETMLSCH